MAAFGENNFVLLSLADMACSFQGKGRAGFFCCLAGLLPGDVFAGLGMPSVASSFSGAAQARVLLWTPTEVSGYEAALARRSYKVVTVC